MDLYHDIESSAQYEFLTPAALEQRIRDCPVAYLPLGTMEWHGPHLPLGTDALQGIALFRLAAERFGGVVIPPLYLGPDRTVREDGREYFGMEVYLDHIHCPRPYPPTLLPGNAFWLPDDVFDAMLSGMIRQLARIGFRVFAATGHGPSVHHFARLAGVLEPELSIRMLTVDHGQQEPRFISDHAAESETSNILYFYPDLVQMDALPEHWQDTVVGIAGNDPKRCASADNLAHRLPGILERLGSSIQDALTSLGR